MNASDKQQPTITVHSINRFRRGLDIKVGDLPYDIWRVFDGLKFRAAQKPRIVSIADLISTKDELADEEYLKGAKSDPRLIAFNRMTLAGRGCAEGRAPLRVREATDGTFEVIDGNATAQVLMLVGWKEVPVDVIN